MLLLRDPGIAYMHTWLVLTSKVCLRCGAVAGQQASGADQAECGWYPAAGRHHPGHQQGWRKHEVSGTAGLELKLPVGLFCLRQLPLQGRLLLVNRQQGQCLCATRHQTSATSKVWSASCARACERCLLCHRCLKLWLELFAAAACAAVAAVQGDCQATGHVGSGHAVCGK